MELSTERSNFEKLRIYELAEQLSDLVWEIVSGWPPFEKNTVGGQVVRSTESIGANIAEGSGRGSDKDYLRFLRIARGSLYETRHWLRSSYRKKLLTDEQVTAARDLMGELTPKLNAYIGSVKRKKVNVVDEPKTKSQRPKTV